MKILKILFFNFIIFNFIYSQNSGFTLICSGNYFGEYQNLAKHYEAIKMIENTKKNVLKINIGNNLTENKDINDIFYRYYRDLKFSINFMGIEETDSFVSKNKNLEQDYISINILYNRIKPYDIIKVSDINIAVIGITDGYDSTTNNIVYYKNEIQKLLYKLENKTACVFVVSDLSRGENIELIKSFSEIDVIIESGKNINIEPIIKVSKKQYIIPVNNISFYDIEYNPDGVKVFDMYKRPVKKENFVIQNFHEIDINYYNGDKKFQEFIDKQNEVIEIKNRIIAGYNEQTFSAKDILVGDKIKILDKIAKKMASYYNADLVIFPSYILKTGMYQGLYSEVEIDSIFSKDRVLVFYTELDKLKELIDKSEKNKGNVKYLYFSGLEKIIKKDKYKIATFDSMLQDYYEIIGEKYNVREYSIKDILRGEMDEK